MIMYKSWCMNAVTALLVVLSVAVPQDEASQELLKQPDEDLFFLEGLQVIDPGEDKSISEESIEVPKDAVSNGEPAKDILHPTRDMVSRFELANAYVTPRSNQKNPKYYSYFQSSEETSIEGGTESRDKSDESDNKEESNEDDSKDTSEEDDNNTIRDDEDDSEEGSGENDDDVEEGSADSEGSGKGLFNWEIEESSGDYGSGEMEASGDFGLGQDELENFVHLLVEDDLEEFTASSEEDVSGDLNSEEYDNYDDGSNIEYYSPENTNIIIGYGGSPIGDMAKIDLLENDMHQIKGQISQMSARMEQQSADIVHLQSIILQLQEQINKVIFYSNTQDHIIN